MRNRFLDPPADLERQPKVVVRLGIIRPGLNRLLEVLYCLVDPSAAAMPLPRLLWASA